MRELYVSYNTIKIIIVNALNYYKDLGIGYDIFLITPSCVAICHITEQEDKTHFEENYKDNATLVESKDDAIAIGSYCVETSTNLTSALESVGDYFPSPRCQFPDAPYRKMTKFTCDGDGNMRFRGPILTDEGSFSTDFTLGMAVAITGTVIFTEGSAIVEGVGTLFSSELDKDKYLRLSTDTDDCFLRVWKIYTDTRLELWDNYKNTGSGTAVKSHWVPIVSDGGTLNIESSNGTIKSGLSEGMTYLYREFDYGPMSMTCEINIDKRIENQEVFVGYADNIEDITAQALLIFSGTDNTKAILRTSSAEGGSNVKETEFSIPPTNEYQQLSIAVTHDGVFATIDNHILAHHIECIPGLYTPMNLFIGIENLDTLSEETTLNIDSCICKNVNRVEVATSLPGLPLNTVISESIQTITGYLETGSTDEDQTIISYEVPDKKYFFLASYLINADTDVAGVIKIGKDEMVEEKSPGQIAGNISRALFLDMETIKESFTSPRLIGGPGNTIKVTVSPKAITTTIWRVNLDFVLK
jgi:hypothetical protein